jgi:DNA invertase Pin-like site-specific DNA recombinase
LNTISHGEIYDPSHFNDRLLLGLKGTMSEAELHILRARLQGGILNKARRGELMMRPPIGYAYDANARMVFDPDRQIQQAVRLVFETFRRTGSALGTVRAFRQEGLLFPRRLYSGTKGRCPLGQTGTLPCAPVVAQPALRRRLYLWTHSLPQDDRR